MSKFYCYVIFNTPSTHDREGEVKVSYRFIDEQAVYRLLEDTDAMVIRIGNNQRAIIMANPEGEEEVVWRDITEFTPETL